MDRTVQGAFLLATGIGLGLCVVFTGLWWNVGRAGSPIVLEDTISPNTAPLASLLRLPGVGPQRAEAIVTYREEAQRQRSGPVFRDLRDLEAVPGFGPATVRGMAPYLRFNDP